MQHHPPTLDMTPDGGFRVPRRSPLGFRLLVGATVLAVIAALGVLGALVIGFALLMVPVVIGVALVAYAMLRFRIWQARRRTTMPQPRPVG
jgi:hypothetical protein